ncbi:MAG: sigma-70 family RNA polymerase sigma factor [Ruminococcaceae bacterium]|nr:sigma-70 family RNA polymerase sigma factor [Oscillospiraceae bacterium]
MIGAAVWLMLSSIMYSLRLSNGGGSFPKPLSAKEEQHYLQLASQGDIEARNILIERNLRLVAHIMKKYYTQTSDQEDLISIGTIGLIKGISTYDASKGARLATYAARCVENEILMYFRGQRKSASDVSLSDFIETAKDGTALSLMEVVCSDEDLFEQMSDKETYAKLYEKIQTCLEPRERKIIILRYGIGNQKPLTQRQIADLCGISRSYVSRIERKALNKLEAELSE